MDFIAGFVLGLFLAFFALGFEIRRLHRELDTISSEARLTLNEFTRLKEIPNLPHSLRFCVEDDGVRYVAKDNSIYRWNGDAGAWQCIKGASK